jgi:NADH-quinone oxidoreductase subunit A
MAGRLVLPDGWSVLRDYLPAIVFVLLGTGVGLAFTFANRIFGSGRKRQRTVRADPYECGLPSEFKRNMRFGVSFYLVGMLFIIFDLEVLLLFPTAIVMRDFGVHGLLSIGLFVSLLFVAFIYEWRRGALEWRDDGDPRAA